MLNETKKRLKAILISGLLFSFCACNQSEPPSTEANSYKIEAYKTAPTFESHELNELIKIFDQHSYLIIEAIKNKDEEKIKALTEQGKELNSRLLTVNISLTESDKIKLNQYLEEKKKEMKLLLTF